MSATGRGVTRQKDDFYATPSWVTRAILPRLDNPRSILEPAAGEGAILNVCRQQWPNAYFGAFEIDPQRAAVCSITNPVVCTNFLAVDSWALMGRWDLIITNPPFKLALPFIRHSLQRALTVCMFLRLNFLGSQKRAPFWRENPCGVYVLPKRPSFTGKGTDSTEYAWFIWGAGHANRWAILDV